MRNLLKSAVIAATLSFVALPVCAQPVGGSGWIVNATATHAIATATRAAKTGYQQILGHVDASCSTTPASPVLLQVKDGTTVIFQAYVSTTKDFDFEYGAAGTAGNAMSAVLADCGSGVVGSVNLHGLTR